MESEPPNLAIHQAMFGQAPGVSAWTLRVPSGPAVPTSAFPARVDAPSMRSPSQPFLALGQRVYGIQRAFLTICFNGLATQTNFNIQLDSCNLCCLLLFVSKAVFTRAYESMTYSTRLPATLPIRGDCIRFGVVREGAYIIQ